MVIQSKSLTIVDLPGHEKLRFLYKPFMPKTTGIIFMIDSSNAIKNMRVIGELFYKILTTEIVQNKQIPILVLCNKCEVFNNINIKRLCWLFQMKRLN